MRYKRYIVIENTTIYVKFVCVLIFLFYNLQDVSFYYKCCIWNEKEKEKLERKQIFTKPKKIGNKTKKQKTIYYPEKSKIKQKTSTKIQKISNVWKISLNLMFFWPFENETKTKISNKEIKAHKNLKKWINKINKN